MTIDFDQEFNNLRTEYLFSLAEDLQEIEQLIIAQSIGPNDIREIIRKVHSIKGGAASHELPIVSSICHHFEDFIISNLNHELSGLGTIDAILKYIDLLNKCCEEYHQGLWPKMSKYIGQLSHLREKESRTQKYRGNILLVEGTSTMATIIRKHLKASGYTCTVTKNGLSAFNRLLTDKFDAMIASFNLEQLDCVSLTTALRATVNINSEIPIIVISASQCLKSKFSRDFMPNDILSKNECLLDELATSLEKLIRPKEQELLEHEQSRPQKLLYVEDDVCMQKLFQLAMMKHDNIELEFALNTAEALEKCHESTPDLLILDNFLEGCTGQEVFEATLQFKVPSIFLTAAYDSLDIMKLKRHKEFLGIINKPYKPNALYKELCALYVKRHA